MFVYDVADFVIDILFKYHGSALLQYLIYIHVNYSAVAFGFVDCRKKMVSYGKSIDGSFYLSN